jgi:hypothetical protein
MNTLFKFICAVSLTFTLGSCRKEIHEPPANTRNQNFVYVEIDGEKFMVEDRSWNLNRNTKGEIADFGSSFNDDVIYLSINFKNTKLKNGFCYGQLWLECKPLLGVQRPKYMRLSAKLFKGESNTQNFNVKVENNRNNPQMNSLVDSLIHVTNFNTKDKLIEFEHVGNYYDVMSADTILRKIKIKTKINLK